MTLSNYKNMFFIVFTSLLGHVFASAAVTESTFRDQYCTDPRTMKKHAAYSEWADAYSCTRHRCQPGGRNLAIYTVGCKRVEAPESAIECEEVVEDTNMQFPYCCTRLRCLVVVRGEVWTRVLGQPWETLPAAPWSHMYKMKKPPPGDTSFLPKIPDEGPVYELQTDTEGEKEKVLRSTKIAPTPSPDCNEVKPRSELRSVPAPDIVIALSTGIENKDHTKKSGNDFTGSNFGSSNTRQKRGKKHAPRSRIFEEDAAMDPATQPEDQDESTPDRPQAQETGSDEKYYSNAASVTQRAQLPSKSQVAWTEIPQNQWNEHEPSVDVEAAPKIMSLQDSIGSYNTPEPAEREPEKKGEKAGNLQALVDAIGTRMRDIESVVQRMSEKVHQAKTSKDPEASGEKRELTENEANKHRELKDRKAKKTNPDNEHYKRFTVRSRGSKYLHGASDVTTEQPLFVEDNHLNGYFSDASNSVRRAPKNPSVSSRSVITRIRSRSPHVHHEELRSRMTTEPQRATMKVSSKSRRRSPTFAALTLAEEKKPFKVTKSNTGFKPDEASKPVENIKPKKSKPENPVKLSITEKYLERKVLEPEMSLMHRKTNSTSKQTIKWSSRMAYLPIDLKTQHRRRALEPSITYMAPVETRRKAHMTENISEEGEKKKKKHNHKRKRAKGHHKRHHVKDGDKRKRFNKVNSNEVERNIVSIEDASSAMQARR